MLSSTNLKTFPPQLDLPFLNAWRDKIIETAWTLGINTPVQREVIDFEELFNEIKKVSLEKRQKINEIDANIIQLKKSGWHSIADTMLELKTLLLNKVRDYHG